MFRGSTEGLDWVVLQLPDGAVLRIPLAWTDLGPLDPYHLTANGRARFRLPDLLSLRAFIDQLLKERP